MEDHGARLGSAPTTSLETISDASLPTQYGRNLDDRNSAARMRPDATGNRRIGHPAPSTIISSSITSVAKEVDPSTNIRNFGRVCVACNTNKTPLWRGGPQGPKSLCNACGIRYTKARRALAAAAAAPDPGCCFPGSPSPFLLLDSHELDMKSENQYCRGPAKHSRRGRPKKIGATTYKEKIACNLAGATDHKMLCDSIGLSKRSAFHRVFPKDDEDAAMLLIALSGGLVHL